MNLAAHVGHAVPISRLLKNPDEIGWVRHGIPATNNHRARSADCTRDRLLFAIRLMVWAQELRFFPTPRQIMDKFDVHRATAWRWRSVLAEAYGIEPPPVYGHDTGAD